VDPEEEVREMEAWMLHLPHPLVVPQADKDWEKAHWHPLPHVVWDNGLILVHLPHPLVPQAMKDWKTNWTSIPDLNAREMDAWMLHLPHPLVVPQADKDWEKAHWPPLSHLVGENGLILVQLPPGKQRALRLH